MDLEKTIETLKRYLNLFHVSHRTTKLEVWRRYQRYLREWKLDKFESMDDKLAASKKIDEAHEAYDFIKTNWNYLILMKKKDEDYDRTIMIIVFIFLFTIMMYYMQNQANKRVNIAKQTAVKTYESNWAWTHGVSDSLVKLSKQNAMDDFWGKVIKDSTEILDLLVFWPHSLNRYNKNKIIMDILNGGTKHTVFPNGEYQKKSTHYLLERALTKPSERIPEITLEKILFYRNNYEILLRIRFDKTYENQKILDLDLGGIYNIEPRYFPYSTTDSVWTKIPAFPILLEDFFENCIQCGGGIINDQADDKVMIGSCVFRFLVVLPYQTRSIMFKGVGSPLNHVEINIKPYLKQLVAEWREKSAYRAQEWKFWKPIAIK
jgi:hypothetical protein